MFFVACENPGKVMEGDKQLIPVIANDAVVNDPRQVKNYSRQEMEALKAMGTLVAFSSILSNGDQASDAQNPCEVKQMYAHSIVRELAFSDTG